MRMTVDIDWPEGIPLPLLDYTGKEVTVTLVGDIDNGKIARRSRRFATHKDIQATWALTNSEYKALVEFYSNVVYGGAAAFAVELRYPLNSDLTEWQVRFTSELTTMHMEGHWMVECGLRLIRPTAIAEPAVTFIEV